MKRRRFLAVAAGALGVAGCVGGPSTSTPSATDSPTATQTPAGPGESLPDGVYVQRFREGMAMQGTATAGDYEIALMYAAPHVFWTMTGTERSRHPRSGSIHLMAQVWDPETRTVIPEVGASAEIRRDGELVSEEVIYPMLSQRMGFHYGGNFGLAGDGEYTGRVSVGGTNARRTGAFAGKFDESATVEVPLTFDDEQRARIEARELDSYGRPGAIKPMEMGMVPQAYAPKPEALPGTVLGTTESDDARFVWTVLEDAPRFDASSYLAVSARTPYNRLVLPLMGLSVTVRREGSTVFEGRLERTLDPELAYHYGAALDVAGGPQSGDVLVLSVETPPQVARHEGYERAFLRMDDMRLTV